MQPTNIEIIRNRFSFKSEYPIISNIAYTYQYLEYLSDKINREHHTIVITKLLIKDYIVNAISIIEALFYLVLKDKKNFKKTVTFHYLLKIIIKENTLCLSKEEINLLYQLKVLRNKIHIYASLHAKFTDYNSFRKKDYLTMQIILLRVLNNKMISNGKF